MSYLFRITRLTSKLYPRTANIARSRRYTSNQTNPELEKTLNAIVKYERIGVFTDLLTLVAVIFGGISLIDSSNQRKKERMEQMREEMKQENKQSGTIIY